MNFDPTEYDASDKQACCKAIKVLWMENKVYIHDIFIFLFIFFCEIFEELIIFD